MLVLRFTRLQWTSIASVVVFVLAGWASTALAASSLTVAAALGAQDDRSAAVTGYLVGQPTGPDTVLRSGFTSDTAVAIADTPAEADPARMLYVQVTSAYRGEFGLAGNPDLLGRQITVTGRLTAYFSHGGLRSPTAMELGGSTPPPSDPPLTDPPPGGDDSDYYAAALGRTGADLRAALHAIIAVQTRISYAQVWDALQETDEDPGNQSNVILLYSGRSQSKASHGGGANDWNREHVWAKSHGDFGTATGPGTDLHHLRPEDVSVNSNRGNKDFDNGGSAAAECPGCRTDADSWEPRDAVKGDVARMVMYMAVRYEGDDGWPDLELNDSVGNGSAPYLGRLSVLLAWHQSDPPDAFERRRNEVIHDHWQGNRNPFVDHPEWAAAIWSS